MCTQLLIKGCFLSTWILSSLKGSFRKLRLYSILVGTRIVISLKLKFDTHFEDGVSILINDFFFGG